MKKSVSKPLSRARKESPLHIETDEELSPVRRSSPTDHNEARKLILAYEAGNCRLNDHQEEELQASVTHWLHNTSGIPILFDKEKGKAWKSFLIQHNRLVGMKRVGRPLKRTGKTAGLRIDFTGLPFVPGKKTEFTFIDLFAGIGGFRIALDSIGGRCVFSSEWEIRAKETYHQNYGEVPFGDIKPFTQNSTLLKQIPKADILAGGFPCQPFSHAGVSARNSLGQSHGFECEHQGQLFFDIIRIARAVNPKALILENVGHLVGHDGGSTFKP